MTTRFKIFALALFIIGTTACLKEEISEAEEPLVAAVIPEKNIPNSSVDLHQLIAPNVYLTFGNDTDFGISRIQVLGKNNLNLLIEYTTERGEVSNVLLARYPAAQKSGGRNGYVMSCISDDDTPGKLEVLQSNDTSFSYTCKGSLYTNFF